VLFAALDDTEHSDFGAMSQIRRGSLTVTISSGGRAPALSKRLRRHLEETLTPELAQLVEVIDEARQKHGPRTVPFDLWASRWEAALADLDELLALLRSDQRDEVRDRILSAISDG
jgi:siroheme synthase (precorrin-2 oxidase/ferrochelatase)